METLLLSCSRPDKVKDAAVVLLLMFRLERLKSVNRSKWTFTLLGIVRLGLRLNGPLLVTRRTFMLADANSIVCQPISTVGRGPASTLGTIIERPAAKFLHFRRIARCDVFPRWSRCLVVATRLASGGAIAMLFLVPLFHFVVELAQRSNYLLQCFQSGP